MRKIYTRPIGWVECEEFIVLKEMEYTRRDVKLRFVHVYLEVMGERIYYIYEKNYCKMHYGDVGSMSKKAFEALCYLLGDKYYENLVAAHK